MEKAQSGRSLLEMLMTLVVMGILTVGSVTGYKAISVRFQKRTVAETISRLVLQRQHEALTRKGLETHSQNVAGPHGVSFDVANDTVNHFITIKVKGPNAELIQALAKEKFLMSMAESITTPEVVGEEASVIMIFNQFQSSDLSSHTAVSCAQGETVVGGSCQSCATDYTNTCSSCGTETPYWNGTACVCQGNSCGTGAYCEGGACLNCATPSESCVLSADEVDDTTKCITTKKITCNEGAVCLADGTCGTCPEHANCDDGKITCERGYYQKNNECVVSAGKECTSSCQGGVATCINGYCECSDGIWQPSNNSGYGSCMTGLEGDCTTNADCKEAGKYCKIEGEWKNNYVVPTTGTCTTLDSGTEATYNDETFLYSPGTMQWWSARNWCRAQGRRLVSLSDLGIRGGYEQGECSGSNCTRADWSVLRKAFGYRRYWTNDSWNSRYALAVHINDGGVFDWGRVSTFYALCK